MHKNDLPVRRLVHTLLRSRRAIAHISWISHPPYEISHHLDSTVVACTAPHNHHRDRMRSAILYEYIQHTQRALWLAALAPYRPMRYTSYTSARAELIRGAFLSFKLTPLFWDKCFYYIKQFNTDHWDHKLYCRHVCRWVLSRRYLLTHSLTLSSLLGRQIVCTHLYCCAVVVFTTIRILKMKIYCLEKN